MTLAECSAWALITWSCVPDMEEVFADFAGNVEVSAQTFEYDGWLVNKKFLQDAVKYRIKDALAKLTIPKLFIQGTADAPVFVRGFHEFQDVVQPPADFIEIPDAGHTFGTPAHSREVVQVTVTWLKRHFE